MNKRIVWFFILIIVLLFASSVKLPKMAKTKTIVIYEDYSIPANIGISTGLYTKVDGYKYANIVVEFSQLEANEDPVSLGIMFAHSENGKWGSRRYFNFEQNFEGLQDPQMITLSGRGSWHGTPPGVSRYIARIPIMGPYIQVFPFNSHDSARTISIAIYLTR